VLDVEKAPLLSTGGLENLRRILFVAVGCTLPLFAFPVARLFGRPLDLATILAAAFVLASLPALFSLRTPRLFRFLVAVAICVPLLVLVPPRPVLFDASRFAISYLHWLLVVFFFACAASLAVSEPGRRRLLTANVVAGSIIALFAVYQVVGIPRGWPGTGKWLVAFQREPLRLRDIMAGYVRPTSFFLEPAWMGGYLAWVLALDVALGAAGGGRRRKLLAVTAGVLALFAIGASVSWGAYADAAAGLIVTAVVLVRFRGLSARGIALAAGILALVVLLAGSLPSGRRAFSAASSRLGWLLQTPVTPERMTPEVMDSSWVRFRNLVHTWTLFRSRPLRGVGLGQFSAYATEPAAGVGFSRDPWCGWLAIGAGMGVLGPLLLLGAFLSILGFWLLHPPPRPYESVGPALIAVCAVMQVHTGSYIDLWFWYPLSLGLVFAVRPIGEPPHV
jgi:hypothetical protein